MYRLEKQETTNGGVVIDGGRIQGAGGAVQEAIWLKAFLCELGEMKADEAVKVYEDN